MWATTLLLRDMLSKVSPVCSMSVSITVVAQDDGNGVGMVNSIVVEDSAVDGSVVVVLSSDDDDDDDNLFRL